MTLSTPHCQVNVDRSHSYKLYLLVVSMLLIEVYLNTYANQAEGVLSVKVQLGAHQRYCDDSLQSRVIT